ncbi:hypothetical protein [Nocardia sp. NPDC052112]
MTTSTRIHALRIFGRCGHMAPCERPAQVGAKFAAFADQVKQEAR